jgi:ornithine decarboxylase
MTHRNVQVSQAAAVLLKKYSTQHIRDYVTDHESPLLLLDLGVVQKNYNALVTNLPRIKHHYAVKCFYDADVLKTIHEMGGYFDVATKGEIELLESIGVMGDRCVHTHPITRPGDIDAALEFGITIFVFDNAFQIDTLAPYADRIKLLLRLAVPNEKAQINLSAKFGLDPIEVHDVLSRAKQVGLDVIGISFHAGSQMSDPDKMVEGIQLARRVFDQARDIGYEFTLLDIGGGFPTQYTKEITDVEEFCTPVSKALDELFPNIDLMSEPGRAVVGTSVVAVSRVMGISVRGGHTWYYLDDGIYGSYSGVLFEHGEYPVVSLKELDNPDIEMSPCVLAGPTCDSVDVFAEGIMMPDLVVGDIILGLNMGAYSAATTTDFNLFPRAKIVLV